MELTTYGDLKNVIKSITLNQKGEKIGNVALGALMGFIPGADAAKSTFEFIKAAMSKPDNKKTSTWLDKLDIDDDMSRIVDDTVENGFMQFISKAIEGESDEKPLENDFNMNSKMVNYLKSKYNQRTISGINENKIQPTIMNKIILRELIREELHKSINELQPQPPATLSSEIKSLQIYLEGTGKNYVAAIDTPVDLKNILTLIWNGMNDKLKNGSNPVVTFFKKAINTNIARTLTKEPETPKP